MTFQRTPDVKAGGGEHIVRLLTQYRFCVKENDHPPTVQTQFYKLVSIHHLLLPIVSIRVTK